MTSICTDVRFPARSCLLAAGALLLTACGGGSGGGSQSAGTQAVFTASTSPAVAAALPAGSKTIVNDLGDTIVLEKAYLVLSNLNMETSCTGSSFYVSIDKLLDGLFPAAYAHTVATPTSTGVPVVIDILAADNAAVTLGQTSPPVGDYCGLTLNLDVADDDAENLPAGAGEPDMVGRSLYLQGTENGNPFTFSVSVAMIERKLLFNAPVSLTSANRTAQAAIAINYDSWFQGVDPAGLDDTDLNKPASNQLLQNITASLHQS